MRKLYLLPLLISLGLYAQKPPLPYGAIPTERQLRWHETEVYGLIHFTPTTFEDKEWGYGDADPAKFNPLQFDAEQIIKAAKAGGLRAIVMVAKHHDGFCLWPTKTTDYNISKSPFRNGKGDMVREFEQACRKHGLKFGVYCSPWDRNNALYGKPEYVTQVYRKQLEELYSNYGPLFMSWHDGANGGDGYYGGAKEVRKIDRLTYYGWDVTWTTLTRKMQPTASIFSDIGWDVRWVGNEKGFAAETSWATYNPRSPDGKTVGSPGYSDDHNAPVGTRNGETWIPAECDVALRPGWFYHKNQDDKVKSPDQLFDLYFKSVGRGACLDLGLAPDTRGLLHQNDITALQTFGDIVNKAFANNLAKSAKFTANNIRGRNAKLFGPARLVDSDRYSYWATDDAVNTPELMIDFGKLQVFNIISLRENIKLGQRIEGFEIDIWNNDKWQTIHTGTSIGAKRLIRLSSPVTAQKVRLRITASPVCIALSDLGIYAE
jgi:alpha-L-fucosidase